MIKVILLILVGAVASGKLLMMQELFRHGARYPIYPHLDNESSYAENGKLLGELTKQGKRMHYFLGRIIFGRYWEALELPPVLNTSLIYVKSTDVNRTIESVESHLVGMLENTTRLTLTEAEAQMSIPYWTDDTKPPIESHNGSVFIKAPPYQPVAIHVQRDGTNNMTDGDFLRLYSPTNCPMQYNWTAENQKSPLYMQVLNHPKISAAIKAFSDFMNISTPVSIDLLTQYYDNYECNLNNGMPFPVVFEGQYKEQYKFLYVFDLYMNLFYQEVQINATITPFLNQTLNNMRNILKNPDKERLIIYSAHDTTVANVLAALRLTSAECIWNSYKNSSSNYSCIKDYPEYSSNVIFELDNKDGANADYFVKVRYNGAAMFLPFCGYSAECSFQEFQRFVERTIRETYKVDCGIETAQTEKENPLVLTLVIILTVLGVLLIAAVAYMSITRYKEEKKDPKGKKNEKTSLLESKTEQKNQQGMV